MQYKILKKKIATNAIVGKFIKNHAFKEAFKIIGSYILFSQFFTDRRKIRSRSESKKVRSWQCQSPIISNVHINFIIVRYRRIYRV